MTDTTDTIKKLLQLVCESAGCEANTPGDFYTLAGYIEKRTGVPIGLTTTKRLWNYAGLSSKPRLSTLNLLARALGYRNFEDFSAHHSDITPSSDPVLGRAIKLSDLKRGDQLLLRWNPGRELMVEYLDNGFFRVLESVASKLGVGTTFQAAFFALGHPAMIANVIYNDTTWTLYELGQQGGLTYIRHLPADHSNHSDHSSQ